MQHVTVKVPDNYPQDKLKKKIKILEESLMQEVGPSSAMGNATPSKWANLAEEIDRDSDLDDPEFKKAWKGMKKVMKNFREEFHFRHDQ